MKTNVMKQAWTIAREAAINFGGRAVEFFAEALREAWRLAKIVVPAMAGAMMITVETREKRQISDGNGNIITKPREWIVELSDNIVNIYHPEEPSDIESSFFINEKNELVDAENNRRYKSADEALIFGGVVAYTAGYCAKNNIEFAADIFKYMHIDYNVGGNVLVVEIQYNEKFIEALKQSVPQAARQYKKYPDGFSAIPHWLIDVQYYAVVAQLIREFI